MFCWRSAIKQASWKNTLIVVPPPLKHISLDRGAPNMFSCTTDCIWCQRVAFVIHRKLSCTVEIVVACDFGFWSDAQIANIWASLWYHRLVAV